MTRRKQQYKKKLITIGKILKRINQSLFRLKHKLMESKIRLMIKMKNLKCKKKHLLSLEPRLMTTLTILTRIKTVVVFSSQEKSDALICEA